MYGSRFFDILLMDALYAQTPVLKLVREIGWDAVISLKQNSRDLYQSAVRLFAARPPDGQFTEQRDHKTYRVQLGIPKVYPSPSTTPKRCGWCALKKCSIAIATAKAN